jgi:hypothetical protein
METGSAMQLMIPSGRLDCPVDHETDHVLGTADTEITLFEYGSYACPQCRAANERIAQARDQLGDRVCYAFRHSPLTANSPSFRAAELTELARTPEAFWSTHIKLMTRSMQLTGDDLVVVAADLGVNADLALGDSDAMRRARARVEAGVARAHESGVKFTLTFYIQLPALRWSRDRELSPRCEAWHARPPRRYGGPRVRKLGSSWHSRRFGAKVRREMYDRLESPADRVLRPASALSSYAVLPVLALVDADVTTNPGVFVGRGWLMAAIVAGLIIGKPVGVFLAAAAAVRAGSHQVGGVQLAAAGRGGSLCWHRLHDVALHRRAGVSKRRGLLGRQRRRVRRVDFSAVAGAALLWGASRQ